MNSETFVEILNVSNAAKMSDFEFRDFVSRTLEKVKPDGWECESCGAELEKPNARCACWWY
jgi:hypothetical protein